MKKRIITDRIYTLEELSSVIEIITDIYANPNDQKLLEEIIKFGETLTETKKEEPTTK
ncbi:MAG: hypothetical protein WCJ45_09355 [bacterium]